MQPKQSKGERRKRPRHERLIIAMTLVVGVVWLVSIFLTLGVTRVQPNNGSYLGGWGVQSGAMWYVDLGSRMFPEVELKPVAYLNRGRDLTLHYKPRWYRSGAWSAAAGIGIYFVELKIPLWWVLLSLSALAFLPPALRTAHRRRKNRCIGCGYPRDEQLDRCPECGRLASEPSPGFWRLAWRAYRWPLACIAVNVAVTLVAIAVLN